MLGAGALTVLAAGGGDAGTGTIPKSGGGVTWRGSTFGRTTPP
jgi:hypothetical protein